MMLDKYRQRDVDDPDLNASVQYMYARNKP